MNELQRHLQAQRDNAVRLMQTHNQLLAAVLGRTNLKTGAASVENTKAALSKPVSTQKVQAVKKGNVVSLFEYKNGKNFTSKNLPSTDNISSVDTKHLIFKENDAEALEKWGKTVDDLLEEFGGDDALAIHRKILAGSIFFNSTKDAFFYHESANGVMMALCYVGAEDRYDDTLSEIIKYAEVNDLILNIMAQENRVEALTAHGLSTTPVGIWQRIDPIENFTLAGTKMRRLRYVVNKYKQLGDVKTIEYVPGTTPEVDKEICSVMDEWVEIKEADPPFVPLLKKQIMAGTVSTNHLFFLTYRDNKLENVIILSIDNLNDGYLMDAEFYVKDMPLGSTEFAISEMIESFKGKGKKVFSLGLTLGTGLYEHENRSQEIHDLYAVLKKTEFVNGDANAQYKNKYRPTCVTVFMARPLGCGGKKLNDLMLMLGQG